MTTALFIGRFQPFHNGHKRVIEDIAKEVDNLIIGIGSSQDNLTFDNPFTAKERTEMIDKSLSKGINYSISYIPDTHDYSIWVKHVTSIVPEFDVVYANKDNIVKKLFEEKDYKVKDIAVSKKRLSATQIRNAILNNEAYKHNLPKGTLEVLDTINGKNRLHSIMDKSPSLAVDVIMEYDSKLVLIERRHEPLGWALPGGKVDYGETVEQAAIREMKEETSLDISDLSLLGIYSEPERDPRTHMVSIVYTANANGIPKAGDDAKNLKLFSLDELPELAFDHKKILEDYLRRKK